MSKTVLVPCCRYTFQSSKVGYFKMRVHEDGLAVGANLRWPSGELQFLFVCSKNFCFGFNFHLQSFLVGWLVQIYFFDLFTFFNLSQGMKFSSDLAQSLPYSVPVSVGWSGRCCDKIWQTQTHLSQAAGGDGSLWPYGVMHHVSLLIVFCISVYCHTYIHGVM